jgi:hypothetical protein
MFAALMIGDHLSISALCGGVERLRGHLLARPYLINRQTGAALDLAGVILCPIIPSGMVANVRRGVCLALLTNGMFEVWFSYQEHKSSLVRIQRHWVTAQAQ